MFTVTAVYYVAAIISAAVCLSCLNVVGEMGWRIPAWCQCIGPALTLILTSSIPESPRVGVISTKKKYSQD